MSRLLLLVAACAALWSLESVVPLYRCRRDLRGALPNVGLTALLVLTNLVLAFVTASAAALGASNPLSLPLWAEVLVGIIAFDFFTYLAHVALHKLPLAWRFHRVHHSDEQVDLTTAFRQHPGETVWRVLWQLPPIVLLGIPLWVVVVYLTISALNAQLEHANVRVPASLDRLLRLLIVTPDMHKVHHSRRQPETDSNYGNILRSGTASSPPTRHGSTSRRSVTDWMTFSRRACARSWRCRSRAKLSSCGSRSSS